VSGDELIKKVEEYFNVLTKENIIENEIDKELINMFSMK
jgi:hypothetical protein